MVYKTNLLFMCLTVAAVTSGCCASTEFSTESEVAISYTTMGSIVNITSPRYPHTNSTTSEPCSVNIMFTPTQPIGFHVEHQHIGTGAGCAGPTNYSILQILNSVNNQQLPLKCSTETGNKQVVVGFLSSSQSSVRLTLPAGQSKGFYILFSALPLHTMRSADATASSTASSTSSPSGYIISHEGFRFTSSFYNNDINNTFILTYIRGAREIIIDFIYFNIGGSANCQASGDIFSLLEDRSGTTTQIYHCGGSAKTPSSQRTFDISSLGTSLIFQFTADNMYEYRGFLLRYTVVRDQAAPTTRTTKITTKTTKTMTSFTKTTKYLPLSTTSNLSPSFTKSTSAFDEMTSDSGSSSTFSSSNPSKLMTFFKDDKNIIAVSAGGGGLILIIIIVVLTVVAFRKSETRRKDSVDETEMKSQKEYPNFVPRNYSPPAATESREHLDADQISSNGYSMVDLVTDINTGSPNGEGLMSHPQTSPSTARREPEGEETHNIEDAYAVVDKTRKTIMVENDLYGSRD